MPVLVAPVFKIADQAFAKSRCEYDVYQWLSFLGFYNEVRS